MTRMAKPAKGFTMVELMLSMSFVSILLLLIMMTVLQIMNIYNKGISLREVNQVGRIIAQDIQRSIATSSPFDIDAATPADKRFIARDGGGRLCIGHYSYLWNYGTATNPPNKYDSGEAVKMIKIADPEAGYCSSPNKPVPSSGAEITDLLKSGDRNLAIHGFAISRSATANDPATDQALYSIQFIIGTNDKEALTSSNAKCAPPSESDGYENYCAVNKFEIIARSANEASIKE